jgi:hypothetical protein
MRENVARGNQLDARVAREERVGPESRREQEDDDGENEIPPRGCEDVTKTSLKECFG